jgi:hypothetical protein
MLDDEGASDDFSGLTGRTKRSTARAYMLVAFIALIGTVTAIVVLVTASAFTDVFGSGHLFCPDGGDEIWHRPGTHVLLPELVAGLVITGGVWLGIGAILRGREVRNAYGIGLVLASLSAGAVTFHVVASDYLSIMDQPQRYRCGDFFPSGGQLPGWTTVLLFVAFPIVFCLFALGSRSDRAVSAGLSGQEETG